MESQKENGRINPFEPFTILYKILVWAGYYRLDQPKTRFLNHLHRIYRCITLTGNIVYIVQHLIYIVQVFEDNKDRMFDSLMYEIPQLNLLAKIFTINMKMKRLDALKDLMNGPFFTVNNDKDEECLRQNRESFHRLTWVMMINVTVSGVAWTFASIISRILNENYSIPSYFPFETDSWMGFTLSMLMEHGVMFWVAHAHIILDILIACYYAQAAVQIKITKQNLESLCDSQKKIDYTGFKNRWHYQYFDDCDKNIRKRFNSCVDRYGKVVGYVQEVNSIFNGAITFQFVSVSVVICLVVYRISVIPPTSAQFMWLVAYCFLLQFQVFLYCFYGAAIENESKYVSDAMYLSDWTSLSPGFRRQLLIAAAHWSSSIRPRVFGIVPLSFYTFIVIIRCAFNLFTVLKNTSG